MDEKYFLNQIKSDFFHSFFQMKSKITDEVKKNGINGKFLFVCEKDNFFFIIL